MPSTLTSRAIGSYQIQAKPNTSVRQLDRMSGGSNETDKRKKETFADVLKQHLRQHAND